MKTYLVKSTRTAEAESEQSCLRYENAAHALSEVRKVMMMRLTIQEYVARATEKKAENLLAAAYAVAQDKREVKLLGRGRTVVDLVAECAITNEVSARLLHKRVWDAAGREERQQAHAALDTLDKAGARLRESTLALAKAIRALSNDQLNLEVTLPDEISTVAEDLLHSYWNMAYHEGQINYIQTLTE